MNYNNRNSHSSSASSKLRMDRQPFVTRITDPSLAAGKRKEIDNVMKKARANTGDFWDKKLLEVEEKDPNRWRHTGYKKMYIEGDSSSGSEGKKGAVRPARRVERSRSRERRIRSPEIPRRRSPKSPDQSAKYRMPRSPPRGGGGGGRRPPTRSPDMVRRRPRSPIDMPIRRKSPRRSPPPRSPIHHHHEIRRRALSPPHRINSPMVRRRSPPPTMMEKRGHAPLPHQSSRAKPPSPPKHHHPRGRSKSSLSSCSEDSCNMCLPPAKHQPPSQQHPHHASHHPSSNIRQHPQQRARSRSRSVSIPPRSRALMAARSPHTKVSSSSSSVHNPPPTRSRAGPSVVVASSSSMERGHRRNATSVPSGEHLNNHEKTRHIPLESVADQEREKHRGKRPLKKQPLPEDPRLKVRPAESGLVKTSVQTASQHVEDSPPKKHKSSSKSQDKLRARIKIEGEKRKRRHSTSEESDGSSSSENSIPTFTATTRLTLSERFGKMAQWSVDRSNMENMNMRITKDSSGGALKVMIEEGLEPAATQAAAAAQPRRSYSPAPAGHFPEELALTAPSGLMSWDDVRVRYEYYKSRGYLRDLDLEDYIKWEEWWYRYQEWMKQERYYDFWERQQMRHQHRRRKKLPIAQRLN